MKEQSQFHLWNIGLADWASWLAGGSTDSQKMYYLEGNVPLRKRAEVFFKNMMFFKNQNRWS